MAEKEKSNSMQKETLFARIALTAGILMMLVLPWILTKDWGTVLFLKTGPIGDTIGGITAPVSGLLGAYLVFLALKAQVTANNIQMQSLKEQRDEFLRRDTLNYVENKSIEIEKLWGDLLSSKLDSRDSNATSVNFNMWLDLNFSKVSRAIISTHLFLDYLNKELPVENDDLIYKQLVTGFYITFISEIVPFITKINTNFNWEHTIANSTYLKEFLQFIFKDIETIKKNVIEKVYEI